MKQPAALAAGFRMPAELDARPGTVVSLAAGGEWNSA